MRLTATLLLLLLPLFNACSDPATDDAATPTSGAADRSPPSALGTAPADATAEDDGSAALLEDMHRHFNELVHVAQALDAGELEGVAESASWLAEHEPKNEVPSSWTPYLTRMRDAARQLQQADSVEEARDRFNEVLRSCRSCHLAHAVQPPEDVSWMKVD